VEFSIDEGDMLLVRARDVDTGSEQSITVFGGRLDSRSPRDRVLSLAQMARREAEALALDAAFAAELRELLAMAANGSSGEEQDARTALLLEGLLSELSARAAKAGR
jgi:hypothetical protein